MKKIMPRVVSSLILGPVFILAMPSASAVTVTAATPETLAEAFVGSDSGIAIIEGSVQYIGTTTQAGIYTGLGQVPDGILMTTGDALYRDWSHVETGTGSNAQLALIAGVPTSLTYDQNVLTFQFTVNDDSMSAISTSFVLGSNEYPLYVYPGSQYRDVFGFFVDGVNYAAFSDGSPVIATEGDYTNGFDLGYNGKTHAYSLVALLDPNVTVHTLTIAIADVGDAIYDSGIFIGSLSAFSCGANCPNPGVTPSIPEPETWAMLLAGLGIVGVAAKRRRRQK
ncbi:MAG: choice-of-anchor L domain-containing protein [Betaproteobacteria bacterium]|nr:choice-of-anchor L domain-containing protein [Betaproteobacteria bacterium]